MAANQRMSGPYAAPDDPYVGGVAIDYSGGNQVLATNARGLYVGGAGNLVLVMIDGTTVTFTGLLVGTTYEFAFKQINQTGSTATNCVALL